jgi:hypothetical protein
MSVSKGSVFLYAVPGRGMLGAFAMGAFAGCIHVKSLHIVGELHIRFNKLPSLSDALILVLVGNRCMLEALSYTCRNIVGDQFYQGLGTPFCVLGLSARGPAVERSILAKTK